MLLQNPVVTLHRAANMPKISYILFKLPIAEHIAGNLVNLVVLYLAPTFIFSSELYIFNMFSSQLFTQISLAIKTGGLYTIPALLTEIAYQDVSMTPNRSWKVMLHENILLREYPLSFYSPYRFFFLSPLRQNWY